MYLLKFLISFREPCIDVSFKVPHKFPRILDKSTLELEFLIGSLGP